MDGPNDHVIAPKRDVRKRTVNNFLRKYQAVSSVKPRIVIEKGMTQPVGDWSQVWITEVNIIVRQNAPFKIHDWREIPKEEKRVLFNERIKAVFDIDLHVDHVEEAAHKYLGHLFKDFRGKLHKHYLSLGDDVRAKRATPYDSVSQENWEVMCDWFEDPKFKKKSVINKENRQKEMVNHCAGSVSFARFAAKKGLGRIKLYRENILAIKDVNGSILLLKKDIMPWSRSMNKLMLILILRILLHLLKTRLLLRYWVKSVDIHGDLVMVLCRHLLLQLVATR